MRSSCGVWTEGDSEEVLRGPTATWEGTGGVRRRSQGGTPVWDRTQWTYELKRDGGG